MIPDLDPNSEVILGRAVFVQIPQQVCIDNSYVALAPALNVTHCGALSRSLSITNMNTIMCPI
jgi:hypothetical protein